MLDVRLYMAQRLSALAMIPFVLVHLVVMILAIQGGLSASEILARTQGSVIWFVFYALFVLCAALHGAIGLRAILNEWFGLRGLGLAAMTWGVFCALLYFGLKAVVAVTFAGVA